MVWTKTPPDQPGWWWHRWAGGAARPVRVTADRHGLWVEFGISHRLADLDDLAGREWSSAPIREPAGVT